MAEPETGEKITKEDAGNWDPKLCGGTVLPKQQADVEGQCRHCPVYCPWCGSQVRIPADATYFTWFTCCVCGNTFRRPGAGP